MGAQTELASRDVQPAKGWLKAWPWRLARKASILFADGRSRLITVASGCRTCEELAEWSVTVIAIAFTIAFRSAITTSDSPPPPPALLPNTLARTP